MRQTQNAAPNYFNSKNGVQMKSSAEQLLWELHASSTIQDSRLVRKILTASPFYKPPFNIKFLWRKYFKAKNMMAIYKNWDLWNYRKVIICLLAIQLSRQIHRKDPFHSSSLMSVQLSLVATETAVYGPWLNPFCCFSDSESLTPQVHRCRSCINADMTIIDSSDGFLLPPDTYLLF